MYIFIFAYICISVYSLVDIQETPGRILHLERSTSHSPLAGGYGQIKRRDTHSDERMQRKNACKNKHYGIPEWHVFRVMLVIWGGGGFLKSISQKRVPPRPTLSQGLQLTHRIKQRLNDCGLFFDRYCKRHLGALFHFGRSTSHSISPTSDCVMKSISIGFESSDLSTACLLLTKLQSFLDGPSAIFCERQHGISKLKP